MITRSLLASYTEQRMWTDSKFVAPTKLRTQSNTVRFDYDQETSRRH